jgi:hypothetical protein
MDRALSKTAFRTNRALKQDTPKKWTGKTRKAWTVIKNAPSDYTITNFEKAMVFLEDGTRSHGPVRARAMFIPKTRKAAMAGARGVLAANKAAASGGGRLPFRLGRDFVFAKRVRGIKPRRIVQAQRAILPAVLRSILQVHIARLNKP